MTNHNSFSTTCGFKFNRRRTKNNQISQHYYCLLKNKINCVLNNKQTNKQKTNNKKKSTNFVKKETNKNILNNFANQQKVKKKNMLIDIQEQQKMSDATDLKIVEKAVRSALLRAQAEKRITLGLHEAVKNLQASPDEGLFCFLAPPRSGDLATQMNEVLLQAFCLENDIYVIKVSSNFWSFSAFNLT
jgi:hypothetical protein